MVALELRSQSSRITYPSFFFRPAYRKHTVEKFLLEQASLLPEGSTKKDMFVKAAHLIALLSSIYSMWTKSKKKINRLLKMVFGSQSETVTPIQNEKDTNETNQIGNDNEVISTENPKDGKGKQEIDDSKVIKKDGDHNGEDNKKKRRKGGGGRNSSESYTGAIDIDFELPDDLKPGQLCPECKDNKLYAIDPKKVVRLVGHAPVTAFRFSLEQARCICGALFVAAVSEEYRDIFYGDKYSPSALSSLILYKYFAGVPFGMTSKLQKMSGVPVPSSTQVNQIKKHALPVIRSIVKVLYYLAANAHMLGFDDSTIRLLCKRVTTKGTETNKGYGTAVVADGFDSEDNTIILYDFDYNKHAGKVVCDLLKDRTRESLPLLVSDGLPAYEPYKDDGVNVNCNTHMRRKVYHEDKESYIGSTVLFCYQQIYTNDRECKELKLDMSARMELHKEKSSEYFEKMAAIFEIVTDRAEDVVALREKHSIPDYIGKMEPNDDMFTIAIYYLDRYKALTQVLETPGTPLDTNYVERAIKAILRIRNNSLFFHNEFSASYSGDILTLTETINENKINAFIYVEYILSNKEKVLANPKNFLPWIYDKSEQEKKAYWDNVNALIRNSSSSSELGVDLCYHSSG